MKHFLGELLNPKSFAIYGANNTYGTTFGTFNLINIIRCGYKGKIYPIHLKLDNVLGHKAYKTIADVPEVPDLVIIVLPTDVVPQVLRECGEKGVKYAVIISGGFRELGTNDLTQEIVDIANKYSMRFIGPNCFGFYNAFINTEADNMFNMMVFADQPKRGKFSLASQSGTMTSHIFFDPDHRDLDIGKTISIGNEANTDLVDFLEYFKDDNETEVIGLYIEEVKRGKEFVKLAREITPNKPIVTIYSGGSKASNRAIMSHTGSIAGNSKIFESMCKETGIILTDEVQEFLDVAGALQKLKVLPKGRRLGIITNSGGPGAMIAKNAEKKGLIVPEFSEELQNKLKKMVAHTASFKNPLDLTFDTNIFNFLLSYPKILMQSGELDAIILYGAIGFFEQGEIIMENEKLRPYVKAPMQGDEGSRINMQEIEKVFITPTIKLSRKYGIPIFYINPQDYACNWSKKMREQGAIVFQYWDRPVNCLAKICEYSEHIRNNSQS